MSGCVTRYINRFARKALWNSIYRGRFYVAEQQNRSLPIVQTSSFENVDNQDDDKCPRNLTNPIAWRLPRRSLTSTALTID